MESNDSYIQPDISYQNSTAAVLKTDVCVVDFEKTELSILLFVTLLLNVVAVTVLIKIRLSDQAVGHFLVVTLAINDLVTTLLFSIMLVGGWIVCGSVLEEISCQVLGWLSTVMVVWSAWIIIIMSVVRYLATVKPFFYRTMVTIRKVAVALAITLVFTLLQLIFPFSSLAVPYSFYEDNRICAYQFAPGRGGVTHRAILGILAVEGLLATLVILYCNVSIIYKLRRKNAVHVAPSRAINTKNSYTSKRTAFANVTKVVSVVYCLCYGPFLVRVLYDVIVNSPDQNELRHSITMILLFMSPLLNPLVYVACNKKYRDYIVNSLKLFWSKVTFRRRPQTDTNAVEVYTTATTVVSTTANNTRC